MQKYDQLEKNIFCLYHYNENLDRRPGAHPWGESIQVGGTSNTPNWIDDGLIEVGSGLDSAEVIHMGETRASATIKLVAQHPECFYNEISGEYESDNDIPCYTDTDGDTLIPNYIGDMDLTIQVKDSVYIKDRRNLRLKIHPVNDPPLIDFYTDSEVYVNNVNYPTDINIELKAWDIEEGENVEFRNVEIINSEYLDKMTSLISTQIGTEDADINEDDELSVVECIEYGKEIKYLTNYKPDIITYAMFEEIGKTFLENKLNIHSTDKASSSLEQSDSQIENKKPENNTFDLKLNFEQKSSI